MLLHAYTSVTPKDASILSNYNRRSYKRIGDYYIIEREITNELRVVYDASRKTYP